MAVSFPAFPTIENFLSLLTEMKNVYHASPLSADKTSKIIKKIREIEKKITTTHASLEKIPELMASQPMNAFFFLRTHVNSINLQINEFYQLMDSSFAIYITEKRTELPRMNPVPQYFVENHDIFLIAALQFPKKFKLAQKKYNEALQAYFVKLYHGLPPKLVVFDFDETMVNGHFHNLICKLDEVTIDNNLDTFKASKAYQDADEKTQKELIEKFNNTFESIKGTFNTLKTDEQRKIIYDLLSKSKKPGIKNKKHLKETLEALVKAGFQVAIASFSNYPAAIMLILEFIGLNKDTLEHFRQPGHVIAYLPESTCEFQDPLNPTLIKSVKNPNHENGKIGHIKAALRAINTYIVVKDQIELAESLLLDDSEHNVNLAKNNHVRGIQVTKDVIPETGDENPSKAHHDYLQRLLKICRLSPPEGKIKAEQEEKKVRETPAKTNERPKKA